jgi:hypothetical protein
VAEKTIQDAQNVIMVRGAVPSGPKWLEDYADNRKYTLCMDTAFVHIDNYGKHRVNTQNIETKITLPFGEPSCTVSLVPANAVRMRNCLVWKGNVLEGGLGYSTQKLATVCFAGSDIELHSLDNAYHSEPRQERPRRQENPRQENPRQENSPARGARMLRADGNRRNAVFYPA